MHARRPVPRLALLLCCLPVLLMGVLSAKARRAGDRADTPGSSADSSPAAPLPPGTRPAPTTPAPDGQPAQTTPPPVAKPPPKPQPRVEWSYIGLEIQPVEPRVVTLVSTGDSRVAAGFERRSEDATTRTVIYDGQDGQAVSRIAESEPLSLQDGRGNLSALTVRADQIQLIIHTESGGTRIARLPQPQIASAALPYQINAGHFAPDGALILLGSGRDRLYRVNLALGEVRPILPAQPLDIVDFDVNADNELVVLDAFDQQIVWLDLTGEIKASVLLTKNEGREPGFYYLSVAAATGRAAWLGAAVRQEDGSFVPEVQRVQGKLRERQRLDRGEGSLGFPLKLANDGRGGIFAVDENNWIYHISSSTQLTRAWQAVPDGNAATRARRPVYVAHSGTELGNFGPLMQSAIGGLERCYDRLRQISPKAGGSYRLELTTHDRNIQRVEVYQKDFDDFGLESCVSQVFRGLSFSSRVGHQALRIQLRFVPQGTP